MEIESTAVNRSTWVKVLRSIVAQPLWCVYYLQTLTYIIPVLGSNIIVLCKSSIFLARFESYNVHTRRICKSWES